MYWKIRKYEKKSRKLGKKKSGNRAIESKKIDDEYRSVKKKTHYIGCRVSDARIIVSHSYAQAFK